MTCKDCVHCEACDGTYRYYSDEYINEVSISGDVRDLCTTFKNKADFAEVKHGYWKTVTEAKDNTVCGANIKIQYKICSNCEVPMGLTESDYCPNCGAFMSVAKRSESMIKYYIFCLRWLYKNREWGISRQKFKAMERDWRCHNEG